MRPKAKSRSRGSALAETGPALFMLFILIFFPMVNLISVGLTYLCGYYLNYLELREVILSKRSECEGINQPVPQRVVQQFRQTGIGAFAGMTSDPKTSVTYSQVTNDYEGNGNWQVTVSTELEQRPFIAVPFFSQVAGLGAPMKFVIAQSRLLENPHSYSG